MCLPIVIPIGQKDLELQFLLIIIANLSIYCDSGEILSDGEGPWIGCSGGILRGEISQHDVHYCFKF